MGRRPIIVFLGLLGLLLPLTRLVASAAPPEGSKPPGNNGTVKVDGTAFDDHPDNEPHVGCVFQIDLYNFDEGNLQATYRFDLWAPTGSGQLAAGSVAIGEDPNGGGRDLDASVTVDLTSALLRSGGTPHPMQGWHVRLTVNAEGSIGADVKHKMFWLRCASPSPSPSPSPSVSPSQSPTGSPSVTPSPSVSESPTPTTSASPSASGSPSPSTSVSPESPTPTTSASPSTSILPGSPTASTSVLDTSPGGPPTAFSGGSFGIPAAIAAALLVLGALALRLTSRRPDGR
jgi:hypothetical protein